MRSTESLKQRLRTDTECHSSMLILQGSSALQITILKRYDIYGDRGGFDMSGPSEQRMNNLIKFNKYADYCFACLGNGFAMIFGYGWSDEFPHKSIEYSDSRVVVQREKRCRSFEVNANFLF